jgi:hypothetical protein
VSIDEEREPDAAAGPGDGDGRVLIGYVQWDRKNNKFKAAGSDKGKRLPRFAGVRADEVVARSGKLALRSREGDQADKLAVVIDATGDGELRFGAQDVAGEIRSPAFKVTAKGDLTVAGKITSALVAGVQIESGIATDGMLIPLPKGITEEQVANGQVTLHIHVTPRYQGDAPLPPSGSKREQWTLTPLECRVDEDRRVRCRFLWTNADRDAVPTHLPGTCDYTVLAFVAPNEGGQP